MVAEDSASSTRLRRSKRDFDQCRRDIPQPQVQLKKPSKSISCPPLLTLPLAMRIPSLQSLEFFMSCFIFSMKIGSGGDIFNASASALW